MISRRWWVMGWRAGSWMARSTAIKEGSQRYTPPAVGASAATSAGPSDGAVERVVKKDMAKREKLMKDSLDMFNKLPVNVQSGFHNVPQSFHVALMVINPTEAEAWRGTFYQVRRPRCLSRLAASQRGRARIPVSHPRAARWYPPLIRGGWLGTAPVAADALGQGHPNRDAGGLGGPGGERCAYPGAARGAASGGGGDVRTGWCGNGCGADSAGARGAPATLGPLWCPLHPGGGGGPHQRTPACASRPGEHVVHPVYNGRCGRRTSPGVHAIRFGEPSCQLDAGA